LTVQQTQKVHCHVRLVQGHRATHSVEPDSELEILSEVLGKIFSTVALPPRSGQFQQVSRRARPQQKNQPRQRAFGDLGLSYGGSQQKKKAGQDCFREVSHIQKERQALRVPAFQSTLS